MSLGNHHQSTETRMIHSARNPKKQKGAINNPIYQTSTVAFDSYRDFLVAENSYYGKSTINPRELTYGRNGTETTFDCEELISLMEDYPDEKLYTKATSCGYSAIITAINAFVTGSNDHILITDGVYNPVQRFVKHLRRFGVDVQFYNPLAGYDEIKSLIKPNTKLIYCENPSFMTFEVQDIPAISRAAREHNIPVLLDITWATSLNYSGFKHGADVVIQSCTKFILGHSDYMMGSVTFKEKYYNLLVSSFRELGANTTPFNAYMAMRGIRTLSSRLAHLQKNADVVINSLRGHNKISRILHPSQPECPGHEVFKRDFTGYPGLFLVCLDKKYSDDKLDKFFDILSLFSIGYSFGGYESLIITGDTISTMKSLPTSKTYSDTTNLRIYVGLEDPSDISQNLIDALNIL